MFNKKSLKCIESKGLGRYQVHVYGHRFFHWTDDRLTDKTDCLTPLCACTHGVIPLWEAFKGYIERLDI